jgi:hypothetical protein
MTNEKDSKKSQGKLKGVLSISIISFVVSSIGFIPLILAMRYMLFFISFDQMWQYFLLPFFISIGISIAIFSQFFVSGIIIHVFNIKYKPGVYEYRYSDKMAFRWMVLCSLYTPMRKMLEIFPVGGTKYMYYRMLGMELGENTLVGGTIMDPCLTEIGENCTIGLFSVIYGHIHDYEKGTLIMDRIKIGNNCVIGAGAIIMPGAVLEDNVKLATGSIVKRGQVLKSGKIYGGIPAKEIILKKDKKSNS